MLCSSYRWTTICYVPILHAGECCRCYSSKKLRRQTSRALESKAFGENIAAHSASTGGWYRVLFIGLMPSSHRVLISEANCYLSVKYNQTFVTLTVQQTPLVCGRGAAIWAAAFSEMLTKRWGFSGDSGYVIWPPCGSSINRRYHFYIICYDVDRFFHGFCLGPGCCVEMNFRKMHLTDNSWALGRRLTA